MLALPIDSRSLGGHLAFLVHNLQQNSSAWKMDFMLERELKSMTFSCLPRSTRIQSEPVHWVFSICGQVVMTDKCERTFRIPGKVVAVICNTEKGIFELDFRPPVCLVPMV